MPQDAGTVQVRGGRLQFQSAHGTAVHGVPEGDAGGRGVPVYGGGHQEGLSAGGSNGRGGLHVHVMTCVIDDGRV